jgi:hypothetical protein
MIVRAVIVRSAHGRAAIVWAMIFRTWSAHGGAWARTAHRRARAMISAMIGRTRGRCGSRRRPGMLLMTTARRTGGTGRRRMGGRRGMLFMFVATAAMIVLGEGCAGQQAGQGAGKQQAGHGYLHTGIVPITTQRQRSSITETAALPYGLQEP